MPPTPVRVSLIASAAPELESVSALCASLSALPTEGFELIAAGPGLDAKLSQELAAACAERGLAFGLVNEQHLDLQSARDQALARAQGRLVCLFPADCFLAPSLGRVLDDMASNHNEPGFLGRVVPRSGENRLAHLAVQEAEFYGLATETCLAVDRHLALKAGGLGDLPGQLENLGRELPQRDELEVYQPMPESWRETWRHQLGLGGKVRDLKLQQLLVMVLFLLLVTLGPLNPQRALSLSAICLLLLYPLNRSFIRHIGQNHPALLNTTLLFCLLRPFMRLAGGLNAAFSRFQG